MFSLHQNNQKGFTLLFAVITSSLMLAVGLAIANIAFKGITLSSGANASQRAFYAANTGLECALFWDLQHPLYSNSAFGGYSIGGSLSTGLVAHWRFDEGTGGTAVDSVGGYTGTLQGNMDPSSWITGKIKNALLFDGVDDYVDIGGVSSLALDTTYAISVWIDPDTNVGNGDRRILARRSSSVSTDANYFLTIKADTASNAGRVIIRHAGTDGVIYSAVGTSDTRSGGWVHVVGQYNGAVLQLYVNGSKQAEVSAPFPNDSGSQLFYIGTDPLELAQRRFPGKIDDVRIYNRSLTQEEITTLSQLPSGSFGDPFPQHSDKVICAGANITDPETGWDPDNGWDVDKGGSVVSTVFDIALSDGTCSLVTVNKNSANTEIIASGYNTCDLANPRRIERALRATY